MMEHADADAMSHKRFIRIFRRCRRQIVELRREPIYQLGMDAIGSFLARVVAGFLIVMLGFAGVANAAATSHDRGHCVGHVSSHLDGIAETQEHHDDTSGGQTGDVHAGDHDRCIPHACSAILHVFPAARAEQTVLSGVLMPNPDLLRVIARAESLHRPPDA